MCLFTEDKEGLVSDKPVACYKLYRRGKKGQLVSFYTYAKYNLKEGDEVIAEGPDLFKALEDDDYWTLGQGFIHAYTKGNQGLTLNMIDMQCNVISVYQIVDQNREDFAVLPIDVCLDAILEKLKDYCICEMEIPASERHWFGSRRVNVCAKKMLFKKEVKINKKSELIEFICNAYLPESADKSRQEHWKQVIDKYKAKGE